MKKTLLVLLATGWFLCGFAQEIEFEIVEHNFGRLNYNDRAVFDFVFTNTGTEPLIVQKPKSNCGCTIPSWPKDPIMPGQKNKVSVTYKTNRVGNINKTVTVTSNAKDCPKIVLRIKGEVLEEGRIKPSQKNGRWGLIDDNGNVIIPFEYDEIKFAWKNTFNVRKKGKWGIIDEAAVVIIPCEYDEEFHFLEAMSVKKDGKWGIIDNKNKVIIPFEYDLKFDLGDIMSVKKGGKWGIIDNKNKVLIPFEYDLKFDFADTMPVNKGGKYGIIDNNNKVVIPFEYDEKFEFAETMIVKKGGKWGIIDNKNNAITKFFAEEMIAISETLVGFKMPAETSNPKLQGFVGKIGAISTNGNLIIPALFENDEKGYEGYLSLLFITKIGLDKTMDYSQLSSERVRGFWKRYCENTEQKWEDVSPMIEALQKTIKE